MIGTRPAERLRRAGRTIIEQMGFAWLYDLSTSTCCAIIVLAWVVFAVAGIWVCAPAVALLCRSAPGSEAARGHNEVVSYFLSAVGVFYGITLGLIAVGTWTSFNEVESRVSHEASQIAALYRDLDGYPEPVRSAARRELREYTDYVIERAWPEQRHGRVPKGGNIIITRLQRVLNHFEPATPGRVVTHAEALSKFNDLVTARRLRLQSVSVGLSGAMWTLVLLGGVISVGVTWLFVCESRAAHALLAGMMAALIGLLIFIMVEMDSPFRGSFGIGPDAYVLVRDQELVEP